MQPEADLLREVLAVAKEAGLAVIAVKVGSIELRATQLTKPVERRPIPDQVQEVKDIMQQSDDEALPELRRRSKALFNVVLPDDQLLRMKGAL